MRNKFIWIYSGVRAIL